MNTGTIESQSIASIRSGNSFLKVSPERQSMNLALVHDDLVQAGGAERVVESLHELYESAPIYTSIYDPKTTLPGFTNADIRTSYMQHWPVATKKLHKLALLAYPIAFEQFDLSKYDVVLSSASRFAKGIITPPETCHICYCHTPMRFAWRHQEYLSRSRTTRLLAPLMGGMLSGLRAWDFASAQRVDYFLANSMNVAKRIRKYYRRDVTAVVYPPIETKRFCAVHPSEVEDYFLVVSRLVGYKRLDLAVAACTRLGLPLRVVGDGPEKAALKKVAGPTITFLDGQSDKQVAEQYARCKALLFPGEEDFGMTPLECMASGRPVIGFGRGGALESIVDGQTGILFPEQTVDSLCQAILAFGRFTVCPDLLQEHAARFDTAEFKGQITTVVERCADEHEKWLTALTPGRMPGELKVPWERRSFLAGV